MAFEWFSILRSFALDNHAAPNKPSADTEWWMLETAYISEIRISSDHQFDLRVDAFPLLYELFISNAEFAASGHFRAEVGEGLRLYGTPEGQEVSIRLANQAGGNNDTLMQRKLSRSNASLFLCLKISELVQSLEKLGLDLESYLTRFPPEYYADR